MYQYIHRLILNRFDDIQRDRSNRCPDGYCTESTGPSIDDSSTTNDNGRRPSDSTGNSSKRRRACDELALYRGLAHERRDFSFGRPRPDYIARDFGTSKQFQDNCNKLHTSIRHFFTSVQGLEELAIQEKRTVDWELSKPINTQDWLAFLKFFFDCLLYLDLL